MRKGSHTDKPLFSRNIEWSDKRYPSKFPPDRYYIQQIKYLYNYLGKQPMYVYIFTDSPHPKDLIHTYQKALAPDINIDSIQFNCRNDAIPYNNAIIEDLFSMTLFDYLIRPHSSFSYIAQIIGSHKMAIEPYSLHWKENALIIDTVRVFFENGSTTILSCKNN